MQAKGYQNLTRIANMNLTVMNKIHDKSVEWKVEKGEVEKEVIWIGFHT